MTTRTDSPEKTKSKKEELDELEKLLRSIPDRRQDVRRQVVLVSKAQDLALRKGKTMPYMVAKEILPNLKNFGKQKRANSQRSSCESLDSIEQDGSSIGGGCSSCVPSSENCNCAKPRFNADDFKPVPISELSIPNCYDMNLVPPVMRAALLEQSQEGLHDSLLGSLSFDDTGDVIDIKRGDLILVVEHCDNCENHFSVRHNKTTFAQTASHFASIITNYIAIKYPNVLRIGIVRLPCHLAAEESEMNKWSLKWQIKKRPESARGIALSEASAGRRAWSPSSFHTDPDCRSFHFVNKNDNKNAIHRENLIYHFCDVTMDKRFISFANDLKKAHPRYRQQLSLFQAWSRVNSSERKVQRINALELQLIFIDEFDRINVELVHSNLLTKKWPQRASILSRIDKFFSGEFSDCSLSVASNDQINEQPGRNSNVEGVGSGANLEEEAANGNSGNNIDAIIMDNHSDSMISVNLDNTGDIQWVYHRP